MVWGQSRMSRGTTVSLIFLDHAAPKNHSGVHLAPVWLSTKHYRKRGRFIPSLFIHATKRTLIFQHSPSRQASLGSQTWNKSEQQLFYLIVLTRIRTRDLWLWYHIKLHAPSNSTQKLKLIGRGGQFTYIIFQHKGQILNNVHIHWFSWMYMNSTRGTSMSVWLCKCNRHVRPSSQLKKFAQFCVCW